MNVSPALGASDEELGDLGSWLSVNMDFRHLFLQKVYSFLCLRHEKMYESRMLAIYLGKGPIFPTPPKISSLSHLLKLFSLTSFEKFQF